MQEVPIGHVTNGVHTATWMARADAGAARSASRPPTGAPGSPIRRCGSGSRRFPTPSSGPCGATLRQELVEYARAQSIRVRLARGESPDYVEAAARVFDPDVLTIGFARRVATYKRLHLFTRQLDRGLRLLADDAQPDPGRDRRQGAPAGRGSQAGAAGACSTLRRAPHVGSRIAFLDDYDLHMAQRLVAGVDLWVNVPRPPLEASGTSGMKVVLNGGPQPERARRLVGRGLRRRDRLGDRHARTAMPPRRTTTTRRRSTTCSSTRSIPLFYERDADGLPRGWIARIKASMQRLIPRFSAERMVREYVALLYGARPLP